MKKQTLSLLTILFLLGCAGTQKITSIVAPKFQDIPVTVSSNRVVFDLNDLKTSSSPLIAKKLRSLFIPALIYWQWNNTIECKIDPKLVGRSFQDSFTKYADTLGLNEKIHDRKLEIRVEKIPSNCVYTKKGHAIILLVAYTASEMEGIFPQGDNLAVHYKLLQDGMLIKSGRITIDNPNQPMTNIWKSTKKFTGLYVDQFNQNTSIMSRGLVEKLMTEI